MPGIHMEAACPGDAKGCVLESDAAECERELLCFRGG